VKIPLDRNSAQAVYLQIRDRIRRLIESGALQPGDQLPSIRSLAETTRVNKLTVIEAYSVLEADGLIYARPGQGTSSAYLPLRLLNPPVSLPHLKK
jgi:DNA-binding transcriptional regulator YhcF (GntR family)